MCNEPLHTCASEVKQLVCLCVSVLTDTMNQTIFRVFFALNNNTKLPAFLCLLPNYTTLHNYTVTSISVCTTELHMLYYYTVDVPTYTVPDMITSVTRNTDFRLCCTRHARQIKASVLYWKLWSELETPLSLQTAWTGMN